MNNQTLKIELTAYVGLEKLFMEKILIWDEDTDTLCAHETAVVMMDDLVSRMTAALNPCFFQHGIQTECECQEK